MQKKKKKIGHKPDSNGEEVESQTWKGRAAEERGVA